MMENTGNHTRKRRSFGMAGMAVFVGIMLLFAALCWWLWHNREEGKPTRAFGYELMVMHGDSMDPEITDGSLVLLLETASGQTLKSGDVIVYGRLDGKGGTLTRLVNLTETEGKETALVKADRLTQAEEIKRDEIVYRAVYSIPLLGSFWDFMMTGLGMLCLIVAPCLVFFLIELFLMIRYARVKNPLLSEGASALRQKLTPSTADDQRENFVDVTSQFTGQGRSYHSPLRREIGGESPSSDEELSSLNEEALEDLTDKYANLDFNPIVRRAPRDSTELERVIIPSAPSGESSILRLTIDGEEAAQMPLSGPREISIKTGGYRIDITVAPNR